MSLGFEHAPSSPTFVQHVGHSQSTLRVLRSLLDALETPTLSSYITRRSIVINLYNSYRKLG